MARSLGDGLRTESQPDGGSGDRDFQREGGLWKVGAANPPPCRNGNLGARERDGFRFLQGKQFIWR